MREEVDFTKLEIGQMIIAKRKEVNNSKKIKGHDIGPFIIMDVNPNYLLCVGCSSKDRADKMRVLLESGTIEYLTAFSVYKITKYDIREITEEKLNKESLYRLCKNYINKIKYDDTTFDDTKLINKVSVQKEELEFKPGDVVHVWDKTLTENKFLNNTYVIAEKNGDSVVLIHTPDFDKETKTSDTSHILIKKIDRPKYFTFLDSMEEKNFGELYDRYIYAISTTYNDKENYKIGTLLEDANGEIYYINGINGKKYTIAPVVKLENKTCNSNILEINGEYYLFDFMQKLVVDNISYLKHIYTLNEKEYANVQRTRLSIKSGERKLIASKTAYENSLGNALIFKRKIDLGTCITYNDISNARYVTYYYFDNHYLALDYDEYVRSGRMEFVSLKYRKLKFYEIIPPEKLEVPVTMDEMNEGYKHRFDRGNGSSSR